MCILRNNLYICPMKKSCTIKIDDDIKPAIKLLATKRNIDPDDVFNSLLRQALNLGEYASDKISDMDSGRMVLDPVFIKSMDLNFKTGVKIFRRELYGRIRDAMGIDVSPKQISDWIQKWALGKGVVLVKGNSSKGRWILGREE